MHWDRKGVILPANKGNWNVKWTKSGAIVPEKITGKYWMYFLGTAADGTDQMGLASSADLLHWTEETKTPVLPRRPGGFDSRVVEPGPAPILTSDGIVLIYNGADDKLVYRTGVAVFDRKDPRKVLSRSEQPIFVPELTWEKVGQVPNVVFVEGMVRQGNRFLFYYGGADKYVGVAEAAAISRNECLPAMRWMLKRFAFLPYCVAPELLSLCFNLASVSRENSPMPHRRLVVIFLARSRSQRRSRPIARPEPQQAPRSWTTRAIQQIGIAGNCFRRSAPSLRAGQV